MSVSFSEPKKYFNINPKLNGIFCSKINARQTEKESHFWYFISDRLQAIENIACVEVEDSQGKQVNQDCRELLRG